MDKEPDAGVTDVVASLERQLAYANNNIAMLAKHADTGWAMFRKSQDEVRRLRAGIVALMYYGLVEPGCGFPDIASFARSLLEVQFDPHTVLREIEDAKE